MLFMRCRNDCPISRRLPYSRAPDGVLLVRLRRGPTTRPSKIYPALIERPALPYRCSTKQVARIRFCPSCRWRARPCFRGPAADTEDLVRELAGSLHRMLVCTGEFGADRSRGILAVSRHEQSPGNLPPSSTR